MLSDPHLCFLLSADLAEGQCSAFCSSLLRMMHWKSVPLRAMDHRLMLSTFVPIELFNPLKIHHCGYNSCISAFLCGDLLPIPIARQDIFSRKKTVQFFLTALVVFMPLPSAVCVSTVDMTTVAMLGSVSIRVSGLCLLPITLISHVFPITPSHDGLARD